MIRSSYTSWPLLSVFLCSVALADEPDALRVLGDATGGVPSEKLLQTYLIGQLRPHFEARRAEVAKIATPEEFYQRQQRLRKDLLRIVGGFPERSPLNPRTVGRMEREGYVIEKVIYESRPRHHVTANLYLPRDTAPPVPGVLVPCGHSANGKAAEPYQAIAISLAQNGMAALVYDPIGQGERHQVLDEAGKPVVTGTTEHTLLGVGGWLVGTGAAHYRIWDGIRSMDYLASRPEVDPKRLGCTGNSGGGTMTSYLMAIDERIQAAAPSCYLTTLERLFDTIGPQDAEQNHPGQVALGIEHADYIALRAPKPTLMCVATQDFFDIDGAWATFREAKGLYGLLGHGERMDIFEYNDKHGFSLPRRQAAMRFLRRWLVGKDDNPDEREMTLSTDAELQCTKSGEALVDFEDGVSVPDLVRERAGELSQQRAQRKDRTREQLLADVLRLTGVRLDNLAGRIEPQGEPVLADRLPSFTPLRSAHRAILRREGEVPVPLISFLPPAKDGSVQATIVIYVSDGGKAADSETISELLAAGKTVLAIDVRGFGETAAAHRPNRQGHFGSDFKTSLLAIHLNRPLLGQRVEDVLAAVDAAWKDGGKPPIELIGVGAGGPVVLHAALLDDRITQVTTVDSIRSWTDVAGDPLAENQLTNCVPFVLQSYDLPEVVAGIAPRKVIETEPVRSDATHGK